MSTELNKVLSNYSLKLREFPFMVILFGRVQDEAGQDEAGQDEAVSRTGDSLSQ